MTNYTAIFCIALAANVAVTYYSLKGSKNNAGGSNADNDVDEVKKAKGKQHKSLLIRYLCVYLMAAASDWLQGPYVYALYSGYGYVQSDIAILFVAGFGSSMIFGSFVGGMADSGGRRKFVIIFALTYIASCFTKHVKDFNVLLLGENSQCVYFLVFVLHFTEKSLTNKLISYLRPFPWRDCNQFII